MAARTTGNKRRENTNNDEIETLAEFFRCFICAGKLVNAHLCPHCSKLCCFACISRWLTEGKCECPHCRVHLQLHMLVKCRWGAEITQHIETMQQGRLDAAKDKMKDRCPTHQKKLSVYCYTCRCCICQHCALWDETHFGHSFTQLEVLYEQRVNKISAEAAKLKLRLFKHKALVQDLERDEHSLELAKMERRKAIHDAIELMNAHFRLEYMAKLDHITEKREVFMHKTERLEILIREIENQLDTCTRAELTSKYDGLLNMIHQVCKQPKGNYAPVPAPTKFHSEIVPVCDNGILVLNGFSALQQQEDPVYTTAFNVNGLRWRIKVFPDEAGVSPVTSPLSPDVEDAQVAETGKEKVALLPNEGNGQAKILIGKKRQGEPVGVCKSKKQKKLVSKCKSLSSRTVLTLYIDF